MTHFQLSAFLPRVSCLVPGPTVTHSHAFAWRKWTLQRFLSSRPLLNQGSAHTASRMPLPRSILLWALFACCSARPAGRPLFPRMRTNLEDSLRDSDITKTSWSHLSETQESKGIYGQRWFWVKDGHSLLLLLWLWEIVGFSGLQELFQKFAQLWTAQSTEVTQHLTLVFIFSFFG